MMNKYLFIAFLFLMTGCNDYHEERVVIEKVESIGLLQPEVFKVTHDKGVTYVPAYKPQDFPLNRSCIKHTKIHHNGNTTIIFLNN